MGMAKREQKEFSTAMPAPTFDLALSRLRVRDDEFNENSRSERSKESEKRSVKRRRKRHKNARLKKAFGKVRGKEEKGEYGKRV